jgi:hypothetical protein
MKQSVVINGVTLTRAQVEQALQDLNKPEPPDLSVDCFKLVSTIEKDRFSVNLANGPMLMETAVTAAYGPNQHLKGKAFYLPPTFNWELIEVGNWHLLIPTKKS